jgi:hypothetical protein
MREGSPPRAMRPRRYGRLASSRAASRRARESVVNCNSCTGYAVIRIVHPNVMTVGVERRCEVSRESSSVVWRRVWLRVGFLGHVNSLFSLRPWASLRALAA